ncbi:glycosyltransferase family 2 protein [Pseudomonadota bacterium]
MNPESLPLVSVGMAVYNRPDYLREALEGVVNQTHKNLEIIISEDCSPCEETKALIREYERRDNRIRCFRQKSNLGPPANIHFVLTQATGEFFMWADDDDLRDERWVEVLLKKGAQEDTAIAIGNVVSIDPDKNVVKRYSPFQFSGPRPIRLARYFLDEPEEGKANVVCGLFRTDFLRSIKYWGEYDRSLFANDILFSIDCLQYGTFEVDTSVTIYKRFAAGKDLPASSLGDLILRVYRRIQHDLVCVGIVNHWLDKTVLFLLIPVKLVRQLIYKIINRSK